jgi:hypothetical protein
MYQLYYSRYKAMFRDKQKYNDIDTLTPSNATCLRFHFDNSTVIEVVT